MEIVREFSKINKNDANLAGGKGASLGEMTQARIPVPPGYVILSDAFEKFLTETQLHAEIDSILHKVNHEEIHTVEKASEEIKALILQSEMPKDIAIEIKKYFKNLGAKFVAVRSSATAEDSSAAAWAGQLESYLNTTESNLLEKVKHCWASLFTPRAIFYRFEKGLHKTKISVAVVVQKMVNSEISGIAFSVHPVTQDYNQLIIEAGFGLGEAIVSGTITPDSYVVEKKPRRIIEKHVAEQTKGLYKIETGGNEWKEIKDGKDQKLTDKEILELSELILRIENHYSFPCDIEWAREKGKFYILQSRPITTLIESKVDTKKKQKIMTNIFSREKNLLYFCMWDDSDRKGVEIAGEQIKNNLFIVLSKGKKGSVWYEKEELEQLKSKLLDKFKTSNDNYAWKKVKKLAEESWKFIEPYTKGSKIIKNIDEFEKYYENLCNFWVCLNSIMYEILDNQDLNKKIKDYLIKFRDKTEKYTEKMSQIMTDYIEAQPKLKDISHIITFKEILAILRNKLKDESLENIKLRLNGCFMINGKVYPFNQLAEILAKGGLSLEELKNEANEIKGDSAFKGVVRGRVKIIDGFKDLNKIKLGDILVTQMTNPKYISAIKNVAGIITDQGGTLCHAAITAREMKKPCIIGTKIATQVLKDGDLVEVDANNGVIKILKNLEQIKKYKKFMTRSIPLIHCEILYRGEKEGLDRLCKGTFFFDPLFVYTMGKGVEVYYDYEDIRGNPLNLVDYFNKHVKDFMSLAKEYSKNCELILKLIKDNNPININKIYELTLKIWPMRVASSILCGYMASKTSKEIVDCSLKLRKKYEKLGYVASEKIIELTKKIISAEFLPFNYFLTYDEINNPPPLDALNKRAKNYIFYEGSLFLNKDLIQFSKDNNFEIIPEEEIYNDKDIIKGSSANKGVIKGTIKVVFEYTELDKVKRGDILVTPMTTPNFLPAMNKASAFITDEGGVMCHAAIVAREMNKPCIVGTKVATQSLKDGDLVEVDANKGIIKIIKRA